MDIQFPVALRGYDRIAVDALIARARDAIAIGSPAERATVTADLHRGVPVVLRGYDRNAVDDAFERLAAALAPGIS
jgi:DivIVA domain-containing protein